MTGGVLVVGIGRPRFGDDASGLIAAEALAERLAGVAHVVLDEGGGWSLLEGSGLFASDANLFASDANLFASDANLFASDANPPGLLVLIDAAQECLGFPVGQWRRLDYGRDSAALEGCSLRGTHTADVASLLQMAAGLGCLPADVWIYAVAGERFAPETDPSPAVAAAVASVVDAAEADVRCRIKQVKPPT